MGHPAVRIPRYRVVEHPADVGMEVFAAARDGLFADAVVAFYDMIVGVARIRDAQEVVIEAEGTDDADLMVGLLSRCLFLTEAEDLLLREAQVERLEDGHLRLRARGETVDVARHEFQYAVKAITYHELFVGPQPDGGWRARIIFDI